MDAKVKTEMTENPSSIMYPIPGLDDLFQMEMDIRALREIEADIGRGTLVGEKVIGKLYHVVSQIALAGTERVCREVCEAVKEQQYPSKPSSETTPF
jgi:hypothetical protein